VPRTGHRQRATRFHPARFAAGLFFLGVAGVFLASGVEGDGVLPLDVLVPILLSGLGMVGLIGVISRSRHR
jgi:hypothetical protein